jgi:hypothetical protein
LLDLISHSASNLGRRLLIQWRLSARRTPQTLTRTHTLFVKNLPEQVRAKTVFPRTATKRGQCLRTKLVHQAVGTQPTKALVAYKPQRTRIYYSLAYPLQCPE